MGAPAFLILLCGIFLALAQASKLDHVAPIAQIIDCKNRTGHGCESNLVDAHLKRAVEKVDEKLAPLIAGLNITSRSTGLEKRNDDQIKADVDLKPFHGDDKALYQFISKDDITGIKTGDGGVSTRKLVQQVANDGYFDLVCNSDPPNLLAALYVPSLGVFVGSIPRSKGTAVKLFSLADKFPEYSHVIRARLGGASPDAVNNPEDKLHAEDMVLGNAVAMMADKKLNPEEELATSKIAIYGTYGNWDKKEGPKGPCGTTGDSKIDPSCLTVLTRFHVKIVS